MNLMCIGKWNSILVAASFLGLATYVPVLTCFRDDSIATNGLETAYLWPTNDYWISSSKPQQTFNEDGTAAWKADTNELNSVSTWRIHVAQRVGEWVPTDNVVVASEEGIHELMIAVAKQAGTYNSGKPWAPQIGFITATRE